MDAIVFDAEEKTKIYTHDIACAILEDFENVLDKYNIRVPSPEDDQRDPDNYAALYGSVYSDLLDKIEYRLIDLAKTTQGGNTEIVEGQFSGTI